MKNDFWNCWKYLKFLFWEMQEVEEVGNLEVILEWFEVLWWIFSEFYFCQFGREIFFKFSKIDFIVIKKVDAVTELLRLAWIMDRIKNLGVTLWQYKILSWFFSEFYFWYFWCENLSKLCQNHFFCVWKKNMQ